MSLNTDHVSQSGPALKYCRRVIKEKLGEDFFQEVVLGEFWFKVSIGGKETFAVRNQLPSEFIDVKVLSLHKYALLDKFSHKKVFASDPWHQAQPGSIRNLTIQTKGCETTYKQECRA